MNQRVRQDPVTRATPRSPLEVQGYKNPHLKTARDRTAVIQRRGLRWYAGGYGIGTDGSGPLSEFSERFSHAVAKRLRVDVRPQQDEKRYAWSDALRALYTYMVDVVVDPIFLTPSREASYDLDVIQYGVLEEYVALAWNGSAPARAFRYDSNPDIARFIDHPAVAEVVCLRETAATEELDKFGDYSTFAQKIRATEYSVFDNLFSGSSFISGSRPSRRKAAKKGRLFVCDIGVAEKLKSKLVIPEGELSEWRIPYRDLLGFYPGSNGLPVGIAYRKTDESGDDWRDLLFESFVEVVEESGFLDVARPVLSTLGIRIFTLAEVLQRFSAINAAYHHKAAYQGTAGELLAKNPTTSTGTVTHIGLTGHRYPLRQSLRVEDAIRAIGDLVGQSGSHPALPLEDLGRMFHRLFQTLRRVAPHDRTNDHERQWDEIISLVDIERYEAENPIVEPVLGFVHEISTTQLAFKLFTHPSEDVISRPFGELPPEAAGGNVGDWFEGDVRFLDGELKWATFRWRPPLEADTAAWDSFDSPSEWGEE
jgi:hypothetical protein